MELLDHIRRIAFVFFLLIGIIHFLSGLLFVNGYGLPTSGLVNRVLFIPFVLSGVTYGFSHIRHQLFAYGKSDPWITYVFLVIGIVIFLTLLGIEFIKPDSTTPLLYD